MSVQKTAEIFKPFAELLRCPVCGHPLTLGTRGGFYCKKKHSFDLSAKGYVNFLHGQGDIKYDKRLFEHRRLVLEGGFYAPLVHKLSQTLSGARFALDAGCGEGYYARALSGGMGMLALDSVPEAIRMATSGESRVGWMVADLTNIPVRDGALDAVLNILAPANYNEFKRVLRPDGTLVKVIPGNDYLSQIRERASGQLQGAQYSSARVAKLFFERVKNPKQFTLRNTYPVTDAQRDAFMQMTPMLFHIPAGALDSTGITEITIHLEVLTGKMR